jgi:cobalt/nickel transport system permease protein
MRAKALDNRPLPEWLSRPEDYAPEADADRFIDKSILSFLGALAGIRNRAGDRDGDRGRAIHPGLRLVSSFVLILLVSLSRSIYFLAVVGTYELVIVSLMSGPRIAKVLKTSFVAALFAFCIFLPSALWGNWPGVLAVAAKVLLSVAAAALVSATEGWTSISRGLSALRVPDIFILVLDLAIKYISLLGGLVLDMLYALKLRSVGRNRDKTASLSGVAGTVFLKSKEAAEEMYAAMECRGFSGTYRIAARGRLSFTDYAFVAANVLILSLFILLQVA